jgi:hypothetical protein
MQILCTPDLDIITHTATKWNTPGEFTTQEKMIVVEVDAPEGAEPIKVIDKGGPIDCEVDGGTGTKYVGGQVEFAPIEECE